MKYSYLWYFVTILQYYDQCDNENHSFSPLSVSSVVYFGNPDKYIIK